MAHVSSHFYVLTRRAKAVAQRSDDLGLQHSELLCCPIKMLKLNKNYATIFLLF